ncbi:MAG: imelysin family protein [Pseudomonadota bacterium]
MAGSKRCVLLASLAALAACGSEEPANSGAADDSAARAFALTADLAAPIVATYADVAHAKYEDSLLAAEALRTAIDALIASPEDSTLEAARAAWLAARVPYQQTEAYRFGNPLIDDWEARVNAWPLDEGLIDYVDASYGYQSDINPLYNVNVIANAELMINGQPVDASEITAELLRNELHEAEAIEANVATGYHAIEFLLWGQDLNGTDAGAGNRPASDFMAGDACTGGNCDRRAAYLQTATNMLIEDLEDAVALWSDDGEARANLTQAPVAGVNAMISGLGSLSYGELAGERMKLGLVLHDPEEEHDCFSDNTHNSHYYNQVGISNIYRGRYERRDGRVVSGPSLAALAAEHLPQLATELDAAISDASTALSALKERGDTVESYDQMIAEGNDEGRRMIEAGIDALIAQTRPLEKLVVALDLGSVYIEGSDALDNPGAVFQ